LKKITAYTLSKTILSIAKEIKKTLQKIFNFQSISNVSMLKFSNTTTSFGFENCDLKIH